MRIATTLLAMAVLAAACASPAAAQESVTLSVATQRLTEDGAVELTLSSGAVVVVPRADISEGALAPVPGELPDEAGAAAIAAARCLTQYGDDAAPRAACEQAEILAWGALVARAMDGVDRDNIRAHCGGQYAAQLSTWDFCEVREVQALQRVEARDMTGEGMPAIRAACAVEAPTDYAARDFCERREVNALAVLQRSP